MSQQAILAEIVAERERQDALLRAGKCPCTVTSLLVSDAMRLSILVEEVGQAAKAFNDCGNDPRRCDHNTQLRSELIQIAAVALGWIEVLDYELMRAPRP